MKKITKEVISTLIGASAGNFIYYFIFSVSLSLNDVLSMQAGLLIMSMSLLGIFKIKKLDVTSQLTAE